MNNEQIFMLILGNAALMIPLFLLNRSESRTDIRMMLGMINSIQDEIKDFHGRLCALEEKYKNLGK